LETRGRAEFHRDLLSEPSLLAALDVSYKKSKAVSACVVYDMRSREVIEAKVAVLETKSPYVPGYFFLREIGPLVSAYKMLGNKPDLAIVNGHGYSHPRRAGLATYFGVLMSLPTIGVAKRLLVGEEACGGELTGECAVVDNGEVVAVSLSVGRSKWYVSSGHGVSLRSAVSIVKDILLAHGGILYPMELADRLAKRCGEIARGLVG